MSGRRKQSQAWKDLERHIAKSLKGKRMLRGADFAVGDVDVVVPDFPQLKIDAKYRQRWAHHAYHRDVERKYCTAPGDVAVLVTKTPKQQGALVTLDLGAFAALLQVLREVK